LRINSQGERNFIFFAAKLFFMKKSLVVGLVAFLLVTTVRNVSAQSASGSNYKNAIGLGIDFGDDLTMVGPSYKHFFTENHVGNAEILFGDDIVAIQAFYQYHKEIPGAAGLRWLAGGGPGVLLGDDNSVFMVRPMGGLDYKINGVPLSFSFDWRPALIFYDGDTEFEGARFGLGFRYAF
jgi:hypothetical protein